MRCAGSQIGIEDKPAFGWQPEGGLVGPVWRWGVHGRTLPLPGPRCFGVLRDLRGLSIHGSRRDGTRPSQRRMFPALATLGTDPLYRWVRGSLGLSLCYFRLALRSSQDACPEYPGCLAHTLYVPLPEITSGVAQRRVSSPAAKKSGTESRMAGRGKILKLPPAFTVFSRAQSSPAGVRHAHFQCK